MDEQSKLKKAVYCALIIMTAEVVGGIMANSLAIITDAAHMLSDVGGFIVSLVCLQLAAKGATEKYTYGFKQAEVLGALLSIAIVWALTAVLLWEAFQRLQNLEEINAPYMFWISTFGFLVNLVLMQVLGHGHSHEGGHGHSHGGQEITRSRSPTNMSELDPQDQERASLAMQAAIAHVIGDIVQSLGVCVAALCIWWKPFDVGVTSTGVSKWNYMDPACTLLFGILVLNTTKRTLIQTIDSLMVKAPDQINQKKLKMKLEACPGVISVHDLHIWALGSNQILCTAHMVVNKDTNSMKTLAEAIKHVQKMGIYHSTIQVEVEDDLHDALDQGRSCGGCRDNIEGGHGGHGGHGNGHGHAH